MHNTQIRLAQRPVGAPDQSTFTVAHSDLRELAEGEVLLAVRWLSLDPYMRGRLSTAKSYAAPVEIGEVMVGSTVAQVLQSRYDGLSEGDWVLSYSGWQTYA
ncbi:MAG TPA: NADP-dependent oxidoreductase, partial [Marmoricola sp.]|nr:NADP-dependent oxidoreductase [Marmoricola sp.]